MSGGVRVPMGELNMLAGGTRRGRLSSCLMGFGLCHERSLRMLGGDLDRSSTASVPGRKVVVRRGTKGRAVQPRVESPRKSLDGRRRVIRVVRKRLDTNPLEQEEKQPVNLLRDVVQGFSTPDWSNVSSVIETEAPVLPEANWKKQVYSSEPAEVVAENPSVDNHNDVFSDKHTLTAGNPPHGSSRFQWISNAIEFALFATGSSVVTYTVVSTMKLAIWGVGSAIAGIL